MCVSSCELRGGLATASASDLVIAVLHDEVRACTNAT